MAEIVTEFETGHGGAIHDCQLDYYGKKLATTSSDNTIKIWDISASPHLSGYSNNGNVNSSNAGTGAVFLSELKAHEGPVWQVAWAHPKFGGTIASCSYDKRVIIWQEVRQNEWQIVYKYEEHTASVNSISWASCEYGLQLACGSSDGCVSVHVYNSTDSTWTKKCFYAHPNGVNAVSWSSNTTATGSEITSPKIVSGGSDNQIRIWKLDENTNQWAEFSETQGSSRHSDCVRDVAWRPNVGLSSNYIASCSQDKTVIVWHQENSSTAWKCLQTIIMKGPVWRVSWAVTGNVLAIASGENIVTLFKEGLDGKFEIVTDFNSNSCNNIDSLNIDNLKTEDSICNDNKLIHKADVIGYNNTGMCGTMDNTSIGGACEKNACRTFGNNNMDIMPDNRYVIGTPDNMVNVNNNVNVNNVVGTPGAVNNKMGNVGMLPRGNIMSDLAPPPGQFYSPSVNSYLGSQLNQNAQPSVAFSNEMNTSYAGDTSKNADIRCPYPSPNTLS